MEQFKVCEKETKTKAFSKEGLARASTMDPEEQARAESRYILLLILHSAVYTPTD
jgi:CCR4-NOT transcription complex subunit 3